MTTVYPAKGWAVLAWDQIDPRTVSQTERGAKVNGLALHCNEWLCCEKCWPDRKVNGLWHQVHPPGYHIVKVEIQLKEWTDDE